MTYKVKIMPLALSQLSTTTKYISEVLLHHRGTEASAHQNGSILLKLPFQNCPLCQTVIPSRKKNLGIARVYVNSL